MPRLQPILIAVIALVGFVLSGFWFMIALRAWPGEMLERKVNRGEPVSTTTLAVVWERLRGLDQVGLPGRHLHFPGLAGHLLVTDRNALPELRAAVLPPAEEAVANALAREPAVAHAWARLAWFRYIRAGGPSPEVTAALRLSIYAAPAKRSLLLWRLRLAALNRRHWDAGFELLLKRQIVMAWRASPLQLVETVVASDLVAITRTALAAQHEDVTRFESLLNL